MPSPLFSTGSPPVTTLISSRPLADAVERRRHARREGWATAGPGRTATRKRSRSVSGASADATTQESSQLRPVGSSTPK